MPRTDQKTLQNATMREHAFLPDMYADDHYPQHVVDDRRAILVQLCRAIEQERPEKESQLYAITHCYTKELNKLQDDFERAGSEIETGAREALGAEFIFIAQAYGFNADEEEMIAPREW